MERRRIVRDPIHEVIAFKVEEEKTLLQLLDTPEFQRLRRISQLGLSSYTYPTATHTRFSHLLGVSHLAGKMFDQLWPSEKGSIHFKLGNKDLTATPADMRLVLRITGLLHDVGHGPFSHAFEHVFDFDHEKMTAKIIREPTTNIHKVLKESNNALVREHGPELVTDIVSKAFPITWVRDIITSQLDADRLDYLLRDAYMCGVKYAQFDLNWIIQHLDIATRKHTVAGTTLESQVMVVDAQKGMSSLEDFITARYHMYEHVYYHKTSRGFENLLILIFRRVQDLLTTDGPAFQDPVLEQFVKDPTSIEAFVQLDESIIYAQIHAWARSAKDSTLKELCGYFIQRRPYKKVLEVKNTRPRSTQESIDLHKKFEAAKLDMRYHYFEDTTTELAYKDTYLLGKPQAEHVWLSDGEGGVVELAERSLIVGALRNERIHRYREYLSPAALKRNIK